VHGFAAPVGGKFQAPHGAVCAALLPHAVRTNLRALRARQPEARALDRYREVAILLTGNNAARAEDAVEWLTALSTDLHIPPLSYWGITAGDAPSLATQATASSSMKANPITLTAAELEALIVAAI
ncbi:MAG: iron-containing alcohol dehydrogenase, partial [Bryobacterales bacterium]|nr:iron-containing alcohol dehydrogenase [Bryobacterales bacterium]